MGKSVTRDEPGLIARLPKRVSVGSYTFSMALVDPGMQPLDGDLGCTTFDPFCILLNEEQSLQGLMNTVLHELQHCINHVYGLEDGVEEEAIARQSANGWQALLIDNPSVSKWLHDSAAFIRRRRQSENRSDRKASK